MLFNLWISKEKNDVILKEEYLNFLINEKTNFADLDKVESHYKSQIITQYSTYNANKTILEEKEKEYNRITTQIETALVSRLDFSQNDFNLYYKKLIKETNKAIRLKEHELECYRNTYKTIQKQLSIKEEIWRRNEDTELERWTAWEI